MSDAISKTLMEAVVQDLRFAEKKITKKEACSRLGIAYNTARLDKLVESFLEEKARIENRKAANRGKKATEFEISTMIEMFLEKEPLTAISERLCRGTQFVKGTLSRLGIPTRNSDCDYFNPQPLDGDFQYEELAAGTVVYSARHQEIGEVRRKCPTSGETGYWVYLASEQNVAIAWYDLLPLTPLIEKYNLKLRLGSGIDTKAELAQTLTRAFKHDK
jgi:hypothetical protein